MRPMSLNSLWPRFWPWGTNSPMAFGSRRPGFEPIAQKHLLVLILILLLLLVWHFMRKRRVSEAWFKYHWICLCTEMFGKVFDFANSHSFDRSGRKQHKSKLCSISVNKSARIFNFSHLAASQSRPHFLHLHFCCISYQFAAIRPERSNGCDFRPRIRISETIYRRKSCNTSPKRAWRQEHDSKKIFEIRSKGQKLGQIFEKSHFLF